MFSAAICHILHIDSVAHGLSILLSPLFDSFIPVQYPELDLYRKAMGLILITLISYFCIDI